MTDPRHDPRSEDRRDQGESSASGSMRSNIAMLLFGLITLFYLVAIDHEEWFHLRPISGVAMALSQASGDGTSEAKVER